MLDRTLEQRLPGWFAIAVARELGLAASDTSRTRLC